MRLKAQCVIMIPCCGPCACTSLHACKMWLACHRGQALCVPPGSAALGLSKQAVHVLARERSVGQIALICNLTRSDESSVCCWYCMVLAMKGPAGVATCAACHVDGPICLTLFSPKTVAPTSTLLRDPMETARPTASVCAGQVSGVDPRQAAAASTAAGPRTAPVSPPGAQHLHDHCSCWRCWQA